MTTTTEQHEIALAAAALLEQSSVAELRRLQVNEEADKLQLTGEVSSFYHKQLAQELVRNVAGDMQLVNHVSVCS